ncbi:hypothetical protein AC623_20630 [Bacillus sp. FJAT-27231]|uniref:hypothetical protein n=1 Tax=Bacillus sp. FJAT-27231 TaxID=1679168 RepID=UPI000671352D|nr:hypothetical protein [Bacillus sp. FJAT-27231]KMY52544.1 hypothetical protein AC623_20630 [Bacillus sp. FJAT-27231]
MSKQQDIFNRVKKKTGANTFIEQMNDNQSEQELKKADTFDEFIQSLKFEEKEKQNKKRVTETHVSHTIYIEKELKEAMDLLAEISEKGWKTRFLNGLIRNGLAPYVDTLEKLHEAKEQERKLKEKIRKELEELN